MAAVTIRPELEGDIEAVLDVLEAVGAESRWIGLEVPFDRAARAEGIRMDLGQPQLFAGFVAEAEGRVIGSIGLRLAPYGVVSLGMAIIDGFRGQGVGARLLDTGLEWARHAGAHKVGLEVWPHNERALALYRRFGFIEEGRLREHYRRRNGELWDAIVMGRRLDTV